MKKPGHGGHRAGLISHSYPSMTKKRNDDAISKDC